MQTVFEPVIDVLEGPTRLNGSPGHGPYHRSSQGSLQPDRIYYRCRNRSEGFPDFVTHYYTA